MHWRGPAEDGDGLDGEEEGRFVDEADVPAASAVAALTADQVDVDRRRILVDHQVVEGRHGPALAPPKNHRRRTTMYPARIPEGAELGRLPGDGVRASG